MELAQIGEIVSWVSPHKVSYDALQAAMGNAGVPLTLALDMRPSNAWRRAAHTLEENRVIRETFSDKDTLHFQFTAEYLSGREFHYQKECDMVLDKKSGIVTCSDYGLEQTAQRLINAQMKERNANDVTRIIQRLFLKDSDLIPIRQQGGVYFVQESASDVTDRVDAMLLGIGGSIQRFEIRNDAKSSKSVAVSIRDVIYKMVDDVRTAMADVDSQDDSVKGSAFMRVAEAQAKLDAYRDLLGDYRAEVETVLVDVKTGLNKLFSPDDTVEADEVVSNDTPEPEPDEEPDDEATSVLKQLQALLG
mgnify:CR=1 FL=1